MPALLTKSEIAKQFQVCIRTVEIWTVGKKIPAYRFGRRCVRYDLAHVKAALSGYEAGPSKGRRTRRKDIELGSGEGYSGTPPAKEPPKDRVYGDQVFGDEFLEFYEVYPLKRGKKAAWHSGSRSTSSPHLTLSA